MRGKTAVVTCAGAGLGEACAERLAREGAEVYGIGRFANGKSARRASFTAVSCDLDDAESVIGHLQGILPIDIVVYVPTRLPTTSVTEASTGDYLAALEGGFFLYTKIVQTCLPTMQARKYGRFISLVGGSARAPIWDHTLSNVDRAASMAFSSGAAREFASSGITFNTIVLGLFETQGLYHLWRGRVEQNGGDLECYKARRVSEIPCRRMGDPSECANLCALLASPLVSYLNGQSITMDGGFHLAL